MQFITALVFAAGASAAAVASSEYVPKPDYPAPVPAPYEAPKPDYPADKPKYEEPKPETPYEEPKPDYPADKPEYEPKPEYPVSTPCDTADSYEPTPDHYEVSTYDQYTTYCAEPTTVAYGTQTYVVTEPTTLTFSSCVVSVPVYTAAPTDCANCQPAPAPAPYPTANETSPEVYPTGTSSPYPTYSGAASKVAGSGLGLAALVGLAAFL